ncbi:hypothetical protein KCU78_g429, partial [Aureobasidium melanogenum]
MSSPIKQIAVLRRRTGQTVQEFFDHHYQVHGALSRGPVPEETPHVYFQTHFFDSAYRNSSLAQPAWTGHNDATELYFTDGKHLGAVFGSEHVKEKVGPDGPNFNDFAACIAMFAQEEVLSGDSQEQNESQQAIVAMWLVQEQEAGAHSPLNECLNGKVLEAFKGCSTKIVANIALPDPENQLRYFQGEQAPKYSAAYQIYLRGADQIKTFRKAQKALEEQVSDVIVVNTAFVCFGVRSLVFDQSRGVTFDEKRQPKLPKA